MQVQTLMRPQMTKAVVLVPAPVLASTLVLPAARCSWSLWVCGGAGLKRFIWGSAQVCWQSYTGFGSLHGACQPFPLSSILTSGCVKVFGAASLWHITFLCEKLLISYAACPDNSYQKGLEERSGVKQKKIIPPKLFVDCSFCSLAWHDKACMGTRPVLLR